MHKMFPLGPPVKKKKYGQINRSITSFHSEQLSTVHTRFLASKITGKTAKKLATKVAEKGAEKIGERTGQLIGEKIYDKFSSKRPPETKEKEIMEILKSGDKPKVDKYQYIKDFYNDLL